MGSRAHNYMHLPGHCLAPSAAGALSPFVHRRVLNNKGHMTIEHTEDTKCGFLETPLGRFWIRNLCPCTTVKQCSNV